MYMYITALRAPRLRNDLYCVEWDVKLYYNIPSMHSHPDASRFLTACRCLEKLFLPSISDKSFILDDAKLAELSNNCFGMKECDILGESKHTLTPPIYFQELNPPPNSRRIHVPVLLRNCSLDGYNILMVLSQLHVIGEASALTTSLLQTALHPAADLGFHSKPEHFG